MEIRGLAQADLDAVNEVTMACNREYGGWAPDGWAPSPARWASERESWARLVADPGTRGFVACDEGEQLEGVVAVSVPGREVRRLFVLPARQGRGVGGALLRRAEAELASAGATSAELWTPEDSPAIDFYQHHGWRRDGRSREHNRLHLPLIGMSKAL